MFGVIPGVWFFHLYTIYVRQLSNSFHPWSTLVAAGAFYFVNFAISADVSWPCLLILGYEICECFVPGYFPTCYTAFAMELKKNVDIKFRFK